MTHKWTSESQKKHYKFLLVLQFFSLLKMNSNVILFVAYSKIHIVELIFKKEKKIHLRRAKIMKIFMYHMCSCDSFFLFSFFGIYFSNLIRLYNINILHSFFFVLYSTLYVHRWAAQRNVNTALILIICAIWISIPRCHLFDCLA